MHTALHELYQECCEVIDLPSLMDDNLVNEIILKVYNAQGTYAASPEMTAAIFQQLWAGVMKGLDEADFDTEDKAFLDALRENVSQFADAKTNVMLREMNAALLDENGALRSFDEFKIAARKITGEYLKNYLKTEYNLAINSAQMAAKWKQILLNADTLPLLQFDAVLDNRTTEICRPLDGVILPIDHEFWKRFYPPNHFNCRSTVRQLASGVVTADEKIPVVEIPDMFRTNLGQGRLIFPENHAYYR